MIEKVNWYKDWFNSPFYHILYQNRDARDARLLIDNLFALLQPAADAKILDLACGKGRHAIYINSKGYDTVGLDMSSNSIREANFSANEKLRFMTGDMREIPYHNHFDYVLNLFTSFGYFERQEDNLKTLLSVKDALKPGAVFVLDFFNTYKVVKELVTEEQKEMSGMTFDIRRACSGGVIRKDISFAHEGIQYQFSERVHALMVEDFAALFAAAGFETLHLFGDYTLQPYTAATSDRIITVARKPYA